jgi:hypothetical protein
MMNRVDVFGYDAGVGKFAEVRFGVTHGKTFDWGAANFCHQCSHGAGVQPAAEKDAERNVAHEVAADGLFQTFAVSLNVIGLWPGLGLCVDRQVPVARNPELAVFLEFESVSRHQLLERLPGTPLKVSDSRRS